MHSIWDNAINDDLDKVFDESKPVWRIETRFHHNVVNEFAAGQSLEIKSFRAAVPHLTGLWRSSLDSYRLDLSRTYIDPFWQLLREDLQFFGRDPDVFYKRKRKEPGVGGLRNVAMALGNLLAVYAKNSFTTKQALHYLKNSGLWNDLLNWQWNKQMGHLEFAAWVERELSIRRLLGKAA